ncbi:uncharacterized protein LOC110464650 [Mizuhopecten yessoensis]|uniref:uncharacterized protein LOC110464650 n=1 Tax=Mizuhopecten yessoensis TaxID=6573 RepID=UPI000B45D171|nr:uncharacterized protein LOC110464650 [Mizuhopecten yessoensis]XP_021375662.1 uncharacterized protein LOC110464650 [Mizuhopecten yessoensis]
MLLKVGTLAVVLAIVAFGNAQQGPPGPPGIGDNFPKFPGVSEVAAPGYHVPEELLIFPEVDLDAYVAGEPVNPEDPQPMIDPGPELHTFSDPRGPTGYRVPFRRFFPGRNVESEYQYRNRRVDIQNDMEP